MSKPKSPQFLDFLKEKFPEVDSTLILSIFDKEFATIQGNYPNGTPDWFEKLQCDLNMALVTATVREYIKQKIK